MVQLVIDGALMLDEIKKLEIQDGDYIPDKIIDREEEQKRLEEWKKKGFARNILITSPESGTGKTVTVKWFMKNNLPENMNSGYVLCDERSPYDLYKEIAEVMEWKLGKEIESKRSKGDLSRYIREVFENSQLDFLLCLDEIDYVVNHYDDGILSSLLHIQREVSGNLHLILISNDAGLKNKLQRKVRSRLNEISIIFNQYYAGVGAKILKYYIYEEGLVKEECRGSKEQTHKKLVKFVKKVATGDMRKLLQYFIIWVDMCGEDLDLGKLNENFFKEIEKKETVEIVDNLSLNEKEILLGLLKSKIDEEDFKQSNPNTEKYPNKFGVTDKKRLRKYYEWVCNKIGTEPIKDRQFKHYTKQLEEKNLIIIEKKGLGRGKGMVGLYFIDRNVQEYLKEIVRNLSRNLGVDMEELYNLNIDKRILKNL